MPKYIQQVFADAQLLINNFIENQNNFELLEQIANNLATAIDNGNKIMICGNGGSLCDSMHFAEECSGRYRKDRKAIPVMALADPAHITCVGNDFGFEEIFARGVAAFGKANDWLICLSTSGNSPNIIRAAQQAKEMSINTIALLGKNGSALASQCDYELFIPAETSDRIQELHMLILHVIVEGIERVLFPGNY